MPKPSQLADAVGISVPYASQLLSGERSNVTADIALAAFRIFGIRLGLLAKMTDADISRLSSQASEVPECHGGDAAVTSFDVSSSLDTDGFVSGHIEVDSGAPHDASAGKSVDLTATGLAA